MWIAAVATTANCQGQPDPTWGKIGKRGGEEGSKVFSSAFLTKSQKEERGGGQNVKSFFPLLFLQPASTTSFLFSASYTL